MWYWIFGFIVSVIIGHFATSLSVAFMRKWQSQKDRIGDENDVEWKFYFGFKSFPHGEINGEKVKIKELPPLLIGVIERIFFTFIIAFEVSGAPIAMNGWIAIKIANNWSFWVRENKHWAPYLISSLIGSLISMLFALFGGVICILSKSI